MLKLSIIFLITLPCVYKQPLARSATFPSPKSQRIFSQIPKTDLSHYFDKVKGVEEEYMKQEGIGTELHPPIVIPVYDDDDDPDDEQPDFIDDLLIEPVA